jgi:hypothetical protein
MAADFVSQAMPGPQKSPFSLFLVYVHTSPFYPRIASFQMWVQPCPTFNTLTHICMTVYYYTYTVVVVYKLLTYH